MANYTALSQIFLKRNSPGIKTLSLRTPSNLNCLPGNGRHLGGSEDQVHLAPDPDRLEGTSHPPHFIRRVHLVLLQERSVVLLSPAAGGGPKTRSVRLRARRYCIVVTIVLYWSVGSPSTSLLAS